MPNAPRRHAERLRNELVDTLVNDRRILTERPTPETERALRTVPRHDFLPETDVDSAYTLDAVWDGYHILSVPLPSLAAKMLRQARLKPGMRVLEIGGGGYNAALIAEHVGPDGHVLSIDIDPDVTAFAEKSLAATGYSDRVNVVTGDGTYGSQDGAPWDRIIVTAEAADAPPAWHEQLEPDGILVAPMRIRGLTRSVAFGKAGRCLVSQNHEVCTVPPMLGAEAHAEECLSIAVGKGVMLRVDDRQTVDRKALASALADEGTAVWPGVQVGDEPFGDLDLWVATMARSYGVLKAENADVAQPFRSTGASCVFDATSLAYVTARATGEPNQYELGTIGHGPHGRQLADRLAGHITSWDNTHRGAPKPHIDIFPKTAPDVDLPMGMVVDKRHSRLTVSWPPYGGQVRKPTA